MTGAVEVEGSSTGRLRALRVGDTTNIGFMVGTVLLTLILIAAIAAPLIAPYDPLSVDTAARLQGPSARHLLGTDSVGRDLLSRLIFGARSAFEGIAIALATTVIFGVPWGLISGYVGGIVDEVLMRVADAVISFPGLLLTITIVGALGPGLFNAMLSVGVVLSPVIARLLRSSLLPLRQAEFVRISRSLGTPVVVTALRHVLPNAMAPVLVQLTSLASLALLIEAALGFLGLGVQLPAPDWGADLANAYRFFVSDPSATVAPGFVLTITAFCISQVGDGLRTLLRTN